ncbi:MAG: hypothetical protein HQK51_02570 [Oligoflexia bacterium]|nr:hypothetical protein [Oligoflexia bacterium]
MKTTKIIFIISLCICTFSILAIISVLTKMPLSMSLRADSRSEISAIVLAVAPAAAIRANLKPKQTYNQKKQLVLSTDSEKEKESLKKNKHSDPIVNGKFSLDKNKHLIVNYDVKLIFDQFLNIDGEKTEDEVKTALYQYLEKELPTPALEDAQRILSQYLEYQHEVNLIENEISNTKNINNKDIYDVKLMKKLFGEVQKMRRNVFDKETVEIFFAFDEKRALQNIQLMEGNNSFD